MLSAWALTVAGPAFSEPLTVSVSIVAGPLPSRLQDLERQTGIELLYDGDLVRKHQSPAVGGTLTLESALRQLLAETDLTFRRAESGAWIIERPATPPLAQQDAAVSEILVVGRRTQNTDIRRFENDVQPYTVVTRTRIAGAHRDNVDQYFTSFVTANTQVIAADRAQSANTLSEIDLRGIGSGGTLVLVDGRRMPSVPDSYIGFRQSDINAIPLHAIERIEVLTGAAGGIHGFGALGGVVNVVLDRNTEGLDLHVSQGISSRGDAHRQGVEARFGRTFADGATDLVLFAASTQSDTVLMGERRYADRDKRQTFKLVPGLYDVQFLHGNSVAVHSAGRFDPATGIFEPNPPLVFKAEFGGATLPSGRTFLPVGFSGDAAALAAALTQHAGEEDFSLAGDEAQEDLGSNPRSDSILANVRHRFGARLEAYADAMVLRSRGESDGDPLNAGLTNGIAIVTAESPVNPFTDSLDVYYPVEQLEQRVRKHVESTRYTAGLMAELPLDWRGTAEIGSGGFRYAATSTGEISESSFLILTGDPSDLDTNPFGDWDAFQRAVGSDRRRHTLSSSVRTRFRDQSLRLAGPVFGSNTFTVLAERRAEDVPAYHEIETTVDGGSTTTTETPVTSRSSTTTSLYAELRSKPLRGIELQLAVRRDKEKDDFASNPRVADPDFIHAEFTGTAYTAGAKFSPTSWLMLRGSYATGEQPPPLDYLSELPEEFTTTNYARDPKRDGADLGADGPYLFSFGGNADLEAVGARTVSLGTVLTPTGPDGPRLAVDFSRIRRTGDVFVIFPQEYLDHEEAWPERVSRAPLTDEDRANGYTGGRITRFDARISNGAALEVDAIDLHADWPLTVLGGRFRLYADATYHKRNVEKSPFQPDVNRAGYRDGPLKHRANGGFEWSMNTLTVGANLQYFGSSLVLQQGPRESSNDFNVEIQGSSRIPSQAYLDLHASWRPAIRHLGPVDDLTLEFGLINVLDKTPPRESSFVYTGPGYSRYGDPRQRRFELVLSSHL